MDEQFAAAVHECSHAVTAFIVGVPQIFVALTGETTGETVPECAICATCREYYWHNDPKSDGHSKMIQDDLRKDAAVAIAGEIGEAAYRGHEVAVPSGETTDDRWKVRSRAAAIHYWSSNQECYEFGQWQKMEPCGPCDTFIDQLRTSIRLLLEDPSVAAATLALAKTLVHEKRIEWERATKLLTELGLKSGPAFAKLPPAP